MQEIVIVLDAGHGGTDRSNKGPTGYIEADGNLKTVLFIRDLLLNLYSNVKVILTRDTDKTLDKSVRGRIGAGADLFHSIHSNAGAPSAKGTEVFYSVDILHDKTFAATMSQSIAAAFNTADRGAKTKESTNYPGEDYFTVVDVSQDSGAKHVLLSESLFHSNPTEESILKNDNNLKRIAEIMVNVYAQFLPLEPKALTPTINAATIPNVSKWAIEGYEYVIENNISDGSRPKDNATREEIWQMICNANKLKK